METFNSGKMISKKMLPVSHECAVCTKFGNFSCERCGETYCSKMCQVSDWREHRRICMPIPRLLQRAEMNPNVFPINRMLMDGSASGFDATDALGNISENSAPSESTPMTQEQIVKLTNSLNKMQLEGTLKTQRKELGASLSEIGGGLSTPPQTPKKVQKAPAQVVSKVDENANFSAANAVKPVPASPVAAKIVSPVAAKVMSPVAAKVMSPVAAKVMSPVAAKVVPPPPPAKKQQNFNPSMRVVQSKSQVIVVHVENHQTIFVVPNNDFKEWQTLLDRTEKYAKEAEPLKNPPEVGHIVLAKPKSSDAFSRALVKRIRLNDEMAKVEFMEYGFTEVTKFSQLKCLSEELVNAPRLVNQFTLSGIPDDMEHAEDVVNFLINLQENQTVLIVKQLDPIEKSNVSAHFRVTLVDSEKFSSINETIKELKSIEPATKMDVNENIQEPQVTNRREIEYIGFSGKNVVLYVLDNSLMHIGFFSAIKESDMALLGKNDAIVNKNVAEIEAAPAFHPRDGETCLAQSADDQRWYRATAQNKQADGTYNLIYLDYGNMEAVPSERIREMKEDFFFPCITSLCFIDGLSDKLPAALVDRLRALIRPYNKITFDEVQYTGEDARCKSSEIINTLKSEGLI